MSNLGKNGFDRDENLSIASSYFLTSVLSAKSKIMNIDNVIAEEEKVMDRVKQIDDILNRQSGNSEQDAKKDLIDRVTKNQQDAEPLESVKEESNY